MRKAGERKLGLKDLIAANGFEVVGQRIRRVRQRANMTIRDLAEQAEVSKNTLLRLEKGERTHISTIRQICKALKLTPEQVAGTEFVESSVVAIHRRSDNAWYNMNTFQTHEDPQLSPAERQRALFDASITPFSLIRARLRDGVFNPNLIELYNPTPSRSHRGYEFMFVLEGLARVHIGHEAFELEVGESICFWAAEVHHYEPAIPGNLARVLSIIIDPFPYLENNVPYPPEEE